MVRLAFSKRSFALIGPLLLFVACSSSSNNNPTGPGADGGGVGNLDGSNGDGGEEIDAGPKPYGGVQTAPANYTCSGEIHVATTGDDNANDGSVAKPYRTIAKATPLAKPGDCVKVHAGTYAETATINFGGDGLAGKPIVLQSADGRGAAIIDSATNPAGDTIYIKNDYVVVDGFEIKNTAATLFAVRFDGTYAGKCVGSVLRNSKLTGGSSALKVYQKTQGVIVEYNEFYGASANVPLSLTGASGLVFRANFCHDWSSGDNGAAQLAGGSTDALFEGNTFQDVASSAGAVALGDGCGSTCDNDPDHFGAVNARAINNLFIRVVRAFDVLGCKNCSILSNTIIDGGLNNVVIKLSTAKTNNVSRASIGTRILDNMFTSPSSRMMQVMAIDGTAGDGLQMDYNLFWNGVKSVDFGTNHPKGADTHSVQANSLLVGPTDFRPGAGSAAIGVGLNLVTEVPKDFLGTARPASGPFDIGAFQH